MTLYTWYSLLFEVRIFVNDEAVLEAPARYPDAMLINALNRGLQELGRIRPDAFYDTFAGNNLNVYEITDLVPSPGQTSWDDPFGLDIRFYTALIDYVVSQMDLAEDEYVSLDERHPHHSKAATGLRLFRSHVLSV